MLDKIVIKYCFFVVISFAISLPDYTFLILEQNLGIPQLPFQKFFFIILPIVLMAIVNRNFHFYNILFVAIFSILFYINETNIFHNISKPEIEFNKRIIFIYSSFITMLNLRLYNYTLKDINKWTIILISIFVTLTYLSYFGVLKNSNSIFSLLGNEEERISFSLFNINIISYLCLWAITLLLIYYKETPPFSLNLTTYVFLILYFFIMMLINASRGSFIVLGLILLVLYSKKIFNNPLYIISFVVITTLLIVIPNLDFFDNFLIINRFNDTSNQDGRLLQIEASLLQFTTSPFTGHGYMNATGNHYFGITRSNFQYTQILGAGGLLLFIPFIAMLYKFFVHKLKNLLNRKALAFLVFGVVYFCFEQPHIFLSLIVLNVFLISYEDI